ncbi:MAG TPA: hypothetical protein VGH49_01895 [Xanthobacteraceae bacterium]
MHRGLTSAALLIAIAMAVPAGAQNLITQDGWEGFATRDADNKFDRCALYNRTVAALSASPYEMLGITRDAAGRVGLLIFYAPRMLSRGETGVRLKLDEHTPVTMPGTVLSDFHVDVPVLDPAALAALRDSKAMEAVVDGRTIRFELDGVGGVLDRLEACVKMYGPKS